MKPSAIITLLTDFGAADPYVGQMKGVIAGICPDARVIDLSHELPPHDVPAAAHMLDMVVDAFPRATIHVAVVDPGVGGHRHAVGIQAGPFTFVGPDNGLFTAVLDRYPSTTAVSLTNPRFHRSSVSATFHGRDIFSPVAAHLARGTPLGEMGDPADDLVRLELVGVEQHGDDLVGRVILVDRFGNLISNVTAAAYDSWAPVDNDRLTIDVGGKTANLGRTYADVDPGELVGYFGSSGRLEIAIRDGSAARQLGIQIGDRIMIRPP